MAKNSLQHNDMVVDALRQAISAGDTGLKDVPGLVDKVLGPPPCWTERLVHQTRKPVEFQEFIDFIEAYPPEGLGATYDILWHLCRDNKPVQDKLDKAVKRGDGEHQGNQYSNVGTVDVVHSSNIKRPDGNSEAAALRRLRKDRPDLHAQVIEKKISPHAAMVEAGFRPKTITVPVDVKKAAAVLARNFKGDVLKLIEALQELC